MSTANMTYEEMAATENFMGFKAITNDAISFPVIVVWHNDYMPEARYAEYQAKGYEIEAIIIE